MASKRKAPAASHEDGASSGSAGRPSGGAASTAEVDYVLPDVKKRNPISQAIYTYNMWTGLYMLDPWEKFLFNSVVITIIVLALFYGWRFLGPKGQ